MTHSARHSANDGKPQRKRMSELHENNPRMAKCDLPHSPSRFAAVAMLSWLLAVTPSIKAVAENTPVVDLSVWAVASLQAGQHAAQLPGLAVLVAAGLGARVAALLVLQARRTHHSCSSHTQGGQRQQPHAGGQRQQPHQGGQRQQHACSRRESQRPLLSRL